jgi:4-carboxymuconolactone decarboxylase
MNVTATLAHHPQMLPAFTGLGGFLARDGLLPQRARELAILRIAWRCQSEYEFGQHTNFGLQAGLTDEEIAAVTRPIDSYEWSREEGLLLHAVDDLYLSDAISQPVWDGLAGQWGPDILIEFLVLVGFYRMLAGVLRSCGTIREPGVPTWPIGKE